MESFDVTDAWKAQIEKLAPAKTTFPSKKKHKVLLFSLFTGFNHWVVPHTAAVVEILGQKSGAFEVVSSNDIAMFEKNNLKQFDAVVLNNNCSINPRRDLVLRQTARRQVDAGGQSSCQSEGIGR